MPALEHVPLVGWWLRRRQARRVRDEAQHLLGEARRILRRYRHRISEEVARDVRAAAEDLRDSLRARDTERVRVDLGRLEERVDRHLAFGRKGATREWAESVGAAVFVALLLRAFVVEAFKIPSGSMLPTLEIGDHLFVNKFVYGLQVPFTHHKLLHLRAPRRGEVVVFIYPHDEGKDFIKRVVAIGGDEIRVRDNRVILNGVAVDRRRVAGRCEYDDIDELDGRWEARPCDLYEESLGGVTFRTIETATGGRRDFPLTGGERYRVPDGEVFVMGDNRDNSHDSRYWGTVPLDYIKGKSMFIWWSRGPSGMRWRRLFHGVHGAPIVAAP
ncbi:MAG: signal peptidase I [Myxococcota bacterium]